MSDTGDVGDLDASWIVARVLGSLFLTIPTTTEDDHSDNDDASPDSSLYTQHLWWLGILMSLTASFGTVCGMALQKIGHLKNASRSSVEGKKLSCWEMPYTWMGLLLMIVIPAPLDVGALAFAKYSVLAPFAGFTLVLNAIVAPRCLGERVTIVDYMGSALICLGTGITTMNGGHRATMYDVDRMEDILTSFKAVTYATLAGISATFVGCAVYAVFQDAELRSIALRRYHPRRRDSVVDDDGRRDVSGEEESDEWSAVRRSPPHVDEQLERQSFIVSPSQRAATSRRAVSIDTVASKDGSDATSSAATTIDALESASPQEKTRKKRQRGQVPVPLSSSSSSTSRTVGLCGCCRGGCACGCPRCITTRMASSAALWLSFVNGLAGSTQQVCVKTLIELLKVSAMDNHDNQLKYPLTYVVAFVAAICAIGQFRMLNFGLEHFDAITYVPMYSANLILTGVLGGWFFLDDAADLTTSQILFFLGGGGVTIAGVLLLQCRRPTDASTGSSSRSTRRFRGERFEAIPHDSAVEMRSPCKESRNGAMVPRARHLR